MHTGPPMLSCDMSTKRGTILVVDDEEAVRSLTSVLLALDGYQVLVAGDYEEAVAVQRQYQGRLDLLLTDIGLPGRSGCELATTVLDARPKLKVLYMSGSPGQEVFEPDGQLPQGSNFLPKPFRSKELLDHVKGLLEGQAVAGNGRSHSRK